MIDHLRGLEGFIPTEVSQHLHIIDIFAQLGYVKVSQFYFVNSLINQYVARLNISMTNSLFMQVLDCLHNLFEHPPSHIFIILISVFTNAVPQLFSILHQFHHNMDFPCSNKHFLPLHDVSVVQLVSNQLELFLGRQDSLFVVVFEYFDRKRLICLPLYTLSDDC